MVRKIELVAKMDYQLQSPSLKTAHHHLVVERNWTCLLCSAMSSANKVNILTAD